MINIPINLLNTLLCSLQSDITPTSHPFSSYELRHTEFSHIESIQYIYMSLEKGIKSHHAVCLITRKKADGKLFSCVYLIDVLTQRVVAFCRVTESWKAIEECINKKGNFCVYTPGNGFYITNIEITYLSGVYILKER